MSPRRLFNVKACKSEIYISGKISNYPIKSNLKNMYMFYPPIKCDQFHKNVGITQNSIAPPVLDIYYI